MYQVAIVLNKEYKLGQQSIVTVVAAIRMVNTYGLGIRFICECKNRLHSNVC